jgi:pimeloyl-ACP methyl ester carboxylesterase
LATTIIPLAGILNRVEEQYRPLNLSQYGQVEHLAYDAEKFNPDVAMNDLIARLKQLEYSRGVVLIGSSLGGCIAAFAVNAIRRGRTDLDWLKLVVVDSPSGSKTFKGFEWMPTWLINSWFGAVFLRVFGAIMMWVSRKGPGLPKDRYITRPRPEVMMALSGFSNLSDDEWRLWVKQMAKRGLTGHRAKVWAQQIRWMAKIGADGSLDEAVRGLDGLDVTYVMCTDGNDVVSQPEASNWWRERCGADVITVAAPHCGYLQMQTEFEGAFNYLLG